jgi:hypothetical protein
MDIEDNLTADTNGLLGRIQFNVTFAGYTIAGNSASSGPLTLPPYPDMDLNYEADVLAGFPAPANPLFIIVYDDGCAGQGGGFVCDGPGFNNPNDLVLFGGGSPPRCHDSLQRVPECAAVVFRHYSTPTS